MTQCMFVPLVICVPAIANANRESGPFGHVFGDAFDHPFAAVRKLWRTATVTTKQVMIYPSALNC